MVAITKTKVVWCTALVFLVGLFYVLRTVDLNQQVRSSDATWSQKINASQTKEALTWLRSGNRESRAITGLDGNGPAYDEAIAMVGDLYKKGALKVWSANIQPHGGRQDSDALVVELPLNSLQRKDLFTWSSGFAQSHGWAEQQDDGQKYMALWWH